MYIEKKCPKSMFNRGVLSLSVMCFSSPLWADQHANLFRDSVQSEMPDQAQQNQRDHVSPNGISSVIVDGHEETVYESTSPKNYWVVNGGVLNVVDNAEVKNILAENSTVNVTSGTVREGVTLYSSKMDVTASHIENSEGTGINLSGSLPVLLPVKVNLVNSTVVGNGIGVQISSVGELWMKGSKVTAVEGELGSNRGIMFSGGIAHVLEGSNVVGRDNGVYMLNGSKASDGTILNSINYLEVNGSSITALAGSAIMVDRASPTLFTSGKILIADHSELHAGNGRLVDIQRGSKVDVEISNSHLSGDLVADDSSVLDVKINNSAQLNGHIINGNSVIIDSGGKWVLGDDNSVKSISMQDGKLGFTGDAFHTLSLGKLAGHGTFDMRINLDTGEGDLLSVNGEASGNHLLNIQNTGVEAVTPEVEPLRVVHTEGGDAVFGLVGSRVDLGTYSYELEKQDTDWFVVGSGKIISPSTQSALALFNAAPTIWNSELTTLRSRMGEVRGQEQGGGWIRAYGNRFTASLDSGVDYRQKQQGMSFGADAPVPVADGHLMLGLTGGYSNSDLDLSRGTSGTVKSYYVGAYGTWLSEEGYYVDAVLKLNNMHNRSKVAMSDGVKAKGDYNNSALGGSVELGKHIKLADDWFVEPYTQLSTVWVEGNSYTLDNGLQAKTDRTQSVLGKVGTTLGRNFAMKDGGSVQPYVRVAMAHEFARNNEVEVNGNRFDNDLFGSRAEVGAGVAVSLSERLQLHADFDYMKGENVQQPWGANVGLRLAF